jgi:hypothetical protein
MHEVSGELIVTLITVWWFDGERFNMRKLNDLDVRKQYQIEFTNMFSALENVKDDEDINRAWKSIKQNIKTLAKESLGLHEMKQHKPWFDEEWEMTKNGHREIFSCE